MHGPGTPRNTQKLSKLAQARINQASALGVHPVSCWEVALLFYGQRLQLNADVVAWMEAALKRPKVRLLPFTPAAAIRAAGLGGSFLSDPADCFIVGTALEMDVPLITKDQRISEWGRVKTIW
jgi:PIN domain nuclease of toxin-antitoxin system